MTRLSGSRTESLVLRFDKFFFLLCSRVEQGAGPDWAIRAIDSVQAKIFGEMYKAFIVGHTRKLTKYLDRKIAVVGLTRLVTASTELAAPGSPYANMWPASVTTLLKLLEVPPVPAAGDAYDQTTEADLDDVSFSVSFATLNTARKGVVDPFPEIVDARKWVGVEVKKSEAFKARINELGPEERAVLEGYA